MPLFQCERCGCVENTAVAAQANPYLNRVFDWTGIERLKDLKLCCACGPLHYCDGTPTTYGKWHREFNRIFLPKGMFETNREGNLQHKITKDTNCMNYALAVLWIT